MSCTRRAEPTGEVVPIPAHKLRKRVTVAVDVGGRAADAAKHAKTRPHRFAGAAITVATVALAAIAGLADTGRHTIRRGETLASIARAHGTTPAAIAAANGIRDLNLIIAGTTLVIPDGATPAGTATRPTGEHTVRVGDTLAELARRYSTTVDAIARENGITNPRLIRIGQRLTIPAGGGGVPGAATTSGGSATATVHTVRPGETLGRIARRYGTTVDAIAQANGITNTYVIGIGLRLTIPGAAGGSNAAPSGAGSATVHTVRRGETLASIARRYGTTVDAIVHANGISNRNLIGIDRQLTIPGTTAGGAPGVHIVRPGDTIASVARRYGTSPDALATANGLTPPFTLYTGNRLFLTAQNSSASPPLTTCPVPGATFFNDYGFPRTGGRFHDGVDLFAPRGTPVVAPVSGRVTQLSGPIGGRQFILYGDDGHRYAGSHLDAFGERGSVAAGTVIGYVGDSGNAIGARTHLHFAVRPNGGPTVNPYPSLHAAC